MLSFLWGFNLFAGGQEVTWGPDDNGEFVIDHDIEFKASECSKVIVTAEKVRIEPGVVVTFEPDVVVECRVDHCKFYSQKVDGKDLGRLHFKGLQALGLAISRVVINTFRYLLLRMTSPLGRGRHLWIVDGCKSLRFSDVVLICENIDWSLVPSASSGSGLCRVYVDADSELFFVPHAMVILRVNPMVVEESVQIMLGSQSQLDIHGVLTYD